MAALLLLFGSIAAALAWRAVAAREQETLQRLSSGLAAHIVKHWPEVSVSAGGADDDAARQALMRMLMTVNPAIQVYMLDGLGNVQSYLGAPGMVRVGRVDLAPLQRFIAGADLPIVATDPMGSGQLRVFSAAAFAARPDQAAPPGYLYIVLDGPAQVALGSVASNASMWRHGLAAAAIALVLTMLVGVYVFQRLARPLTALASRLRDFELDPAAMCSPAMAATTATAARTAAVATGNDEVQAMATAFDTMSARMRQQHEQTQALAHAHREVIANVAHDLRTPLTTLHGHLEALGSHVMSPERRQRHLGAALAQSQRVRRLVQQLFELATLQSLPGLLAHERFRLDEVLADTVMQFGLVPPQHRVRWQGAPPGPVELDGDLQLIERALTNLIDNALRHAPSAAPVQVSLRCSEREVAVLVADHGPGMPPELAQRLNAGVCVRDPAIRRDRGGGLGGLGLAIAQRIAALHGGRLHTLPSATGGTTLCLALPRGRLPP